MLNRNGQATSEAPGFIEARVWADLGEDRQGLVLGELEGTDDITGEWPRLTATAWFTAVNAKVGMMPFGTYMPMGTNAPPMQTAVQPGGDLQDVMREQQAAQAPKAITEDMARDIVLGKYLENELRPFIASVRSSAMSREQANEAHTCPVCQGHKASGRCLCGPCEAVQDLQRTQEHAQGHGEAIKAWRSENNDRRPTPMSAPYTVNGQ